MEPQQVDLRAVPDEPTLGEPVCQVVSDQGDACTLGSGHQPFVINSIPWHHCSHGTEKATVFQGGRVR